MPRGVQANDGKDNYNIHLKPKCMAKKIYALALAGLCAASVSAQDVFVYNAETQKPLLTVGSLQRIEFNDGALNLVAADGTANSVQLAGVDYLLFYNRETVNSIRSASAAAAGLRISLSGKDVLVESAEAAISRVDVYSSDGVRVASASPNSRSASVSIGSQAPGVYIVKAVAGKASATSEIIKK